MPKAEFVAMVIRALWHPNTYDYAIIWKPELFHKCYLLIDRVYSRAHEVITVVTDV
jgi:hypothetical protein